MIKPILIAALMLSPLTLYAHDAKIQRVVNVYDGDTLSVHIDGLPDYMQPMAVRIRGIDTPEINGKCDKEKHAAIKAREFLKSKLVGVITLKNIKKDKYFRLLADVWVGELNLGEEIIKSKNGIKYDGKNKRQGVGC